jgi:hypothetical protein
LPTKAGKLSLLSTGHKKTVLRTIRISKELDEALQKDARKEGLALNSLLSMALAKHVEFERFAQEFRIISVSRELFRVILESIDDKKLEGDEGDHGISSLRYHLLQIDRNQC